MGFICLVLDTNNPFGWTEEAKVQNHFYTISGQKLQDFSMHCTELHKEIDKELAKQGRMHEALHEGHLQKVLCTEQTNPNTLRAMWLRSLIKE